MNLYRITTQTPDNTADQVPDAESVKRYLNDVFAPQVNVRFEVTPIPTPLVLNWDTHLNAANDPKAGNGVLNCGGTVPSLEQQNIRSARPGDAPASNIDIYFIGTDKYIDGKDWASTLRIVPELQDPEQVNACWVVGDALGGREMGKLMQTIAHEVGHVLVGYGHPDIKGGQGPAPLPGTNHTERLMVSGSGYQIYRGLMLVKMEWDEAEKWLKAEEIQGRIVP